MEKLLSIINNPPEEWTEKNQEAFDELFGANGGRYPVAAKKAVKVRAPKMQSVDGVSFAAYIHQQSPDSGAYGGMSFVVFPGDNTRCLIGMVIGTQGLSPDEYILSRPGHARKTSAICTWLNKLSNRGDLAAWSKQDPTRTDVDTPDNIVKVFNNYNHVFNRYGKVMYAIYEPGENLDVTTLALKAFLDLLFLERGHDTLSQYKSDADDIRLEYSKYLMPCLSQEDIEEIITRRKYVILEGPPGTGKTRLARKLLVDKFQGNGTTIQFHPNTTYENFIGGLSPVESDSGMGFKFEPKFGQLMNAIIASHQNPKKPYLLHIDEINRADLAKVLGESIFLFEAKEEEKREVRLSFTFQEPIGNILSLPDNLFILGTMNSSDRSIAIMDIAIRRRFAFIKLWPQFTIVKENSCSLMQKAYVDLLTIFIDYASDEALNLMPGHAYFLEVDEQQAIQSLQTNLYPLLEEYLAQGYIAGFSDHVLAYMQWIKSQ